MRISGWGRYPFVAADGLALYSEEGIRRRLSGFSGTVIPHAMGRSYGDSALNDTVVLTTPHNCFLAFDPANGILTCEAGVTLAEIIDAVMPRGWFLEIVPGTKFITVGGAIASDVHGKNHHIRGCFSNCLIEFSLMLADGSVETCSATRNEPLFRATCGGMGLTGIILTATFRLQPLQSAYVQQKTIRAANLKEIFHLFEQYSEWPYSVAWIDCLASGDHTGRSLLMVGEHMNDGRMRYKAGVKLNVPFPTPAVLLNRFSVSWFNRAYFAKTRKAVSEHVSTIDAFFFPLDAIHHWNRIYGRRGFTQYQVALPMEGSEKGLDAILRRVSSSGMGSFLAVLKCFGDANENLLSFPMRGYTLTLDFKIEKRLFPLLDELDRIVMALGGRLYLSKDVRMRLETMEKGYAKIDAFREIREQYGCRSKFQSRQSLRLEI